jgi:hypothetical protein
MTSQAIYRIQIADERTSEWYMIGNDSLSDFLYVLADANQELLGAGRRLTIEHLGTDASAEGVLVGLRAS